LLNHDFVDVAGQKGVEKRKRAITIERVVEVRRQIISPSRRPQSHYSPREIARNMSARHDEKGQKVSAIIAFGHGWCNMCVWSFRVWSFRVFNHLSVQIEQQGPAPRDRNELEQRIRAAWAALPQQVIRNAIDAQPRRVQLIIDARGGQIAKYIW
jgi:hypothetical protein